VLDHLIADRPGAVPILPVSEEGLPAALAQLEEVERRWVEATHYLGAPGKFALLPDGAGRLKRVLIGVRAHVPEARIRIADGGGGGAEIRLTVLADGRTVAWQLLTPTTGSRETLSDVMRQVRLRLRRRGIVLTGEQPADRRAPRARRSESAR